jgi:hypothetical protein
MANKITIKDFFLKYPYKKKPDVTYVSLPYFPKEEETNHKYSLTYSEYKNVLNTYFEYVSEYLLQGDVFSMPERLGALKLIKYKIENIGDKKTYYKTYINNIHSQNYRVILRWEHQKYPVPFGKFWKLSTVKTFNFKLFKKLTEDLTSINDIT